MAQPLNARVIAEGDSWFDYPPRQLYTEQAQADPNGYQANRRDVLKCLQDRGYNVESVAAAGDRVEDMAYGHPPSPQLLNLAHQIGQGPKPIAVLLSGGGIDLVAADGGTGTAFGMLLNHADSALARAGNELNESVVTGVIDQRLRDAYITILRKVTEVSKSLYNNQPPPILVHGYDYPVPDGSFTTFEGSPFAVPAGGVQVGRALGPAFAAKGYGKVDVDVHLLPTPAGLTAEQREQLQGRIAVMKHLIDRFNAMLRDVADLGEFAHVRYIDLRGTLKTGLQGNGYVFYQRWWENELHPTAQGFQHIADCFHKELQTLG